MDEYQALSSGKLSLVNISLLPIFGQSLLPSTRIQLKYLAKKNLTMCILSKILTQEEHPLYHLRMLCSSSHLSMFWQDIYCLDADGSLVDAALLAAVAALAHRTFLLPFKCFQMLRVSSCLLFKQCAFFSSSVS
jgi:hypothetical protein